MIITDSNFEAEVLRSPKPFLLYFGASWCGPCKCVSPMIDELDDPIRKLFQSRVSIGKVDIDTAPATTTRFRVMSVPTVIVFKDGREVARHTGGGISKAKLLSSLALVSADVART